MQWPCLPAGPLLRCRRWDETSTIAVAIYQEVVRMSDGTAAALATILTVTTIISLLIVFRLTKGKVKIV